ncbi:MAG: ORF6N domain-containing protein [Candidatus Zeuxoniibacter abyssi]|nr:MAG: ORF6N domain-containing protein [Candidatus Persebacteraceae bacterium AB1(2)]
MNLVESLIIELRNQKVVLDSDVAKIYGVATRDINKSVTNNPDKFPTGYVIELSQNEKLKVVENFHHLKKLKFSPNIPKAFTEKGLYMLATILKSKRATQATLQIVETFAKVREFSKVAKSLATEKDKPKQKKFIKKSGELIGDILNQEFAGDSSSETTIELNLAMIKIKHKIIKK